MTQNMTQEENKIEGQDIPEKVRNKPGPKPKIKTEEASAPAIIVPKLPKVSDGGVLSIDDLIEQYDPDGDKASERKARDPFADYEQSLVMARKYPKNPQLDQMDKAELLNYCIEANIFKKGWVVRRGKTPETFDRTIVKEVKTDDSKEQILAYIDKRETVKFPAHWLVFTNLSNRNPALPWSRGVKSWYTNRFESCAFEMQWPLPTPLDPYRKAEKLNACAIIQDDSVRAQLFFMIQPAKGKVIRRMNGDKNAFVLLKTEEKSIAILERIFTAGTKGAAEYKDLRLWEKHFKGLPEIGEE